MDLLNSSLVLYLMIGGGVGLAVYLADRGGTRTAAWVRVVTAVPFWPLYVPVLLRVSGPISVDNEQERPDEMAAAIAQVDSELQTALGSLRGWAEGVLTREKDRLGELRCAWTAQAQRIREMDRLLCLPEHTAGGANEGMIPHAAKRAGSAAQFTTDSAASRAGLQRLDGYAGLGSRAGVDDSPRQVHGGSGVASGGDCGSNSGGGRGAVGGDVAGGGGGG